MPSKIGLSFFLISFSQPPTAAVRHFTKKKKNEEKFYVFISTTVNEGESFAWLRCVKSGTSIREEIKS